MRLKEDVLRTVFYVGTKPPGAKFAALGTAFMLGHQNAAGHNLYLVTARHVAEDFGDNPLYFRINKKDGPAEDFYLDMLVPEASDRFKWFFHPEPSIDLAITLFMIDIQDSSLDCLVLKSGETINRAAPSDASPVGCGDLCYAVGLFTVAPGNTRNFPVIHTGNIARMASREELIPQWVSGNTVEREGYLVQLSNLGGLSGAPVFIRSGSAIELPNGEYVLAPRERVDLLGVWSGSWDAPKAGSPSMRVPVGMGIVVPSERLIELIDSEPVQQFAKAALAKILAAKADASAGA